MRKITVGLIVFMALLTMFPLSANQARCDVYNGPYSIGQDETWGPWLGKYWYYWDGDSDDLVIVLYGGDHEHDTAKLEPFYGGDWGPTINVALYQDRLALITGLVDAGHDVISPGFTFFYNITDDAGHEWLTETAAFLKYYPWGPCYDNIYLFGHSCGGVAVGFEIQKEDADDVYTAAVISGAPVDYQGYSDECPLWHTADTAANTKVRTAFICNEQDESVAHNLNIIEPPYDQPYSGPNDVDNAYNHSQTYYDNMPESLDKEWHKWGRDDEYAGLTSYACHEVFPDTCLDCNKTLWRVCHDWFTGPNLIPVTVEIDATAQYDPYARVHGLTVDDPMSTTFWNENPSPVIATTAYALDYETTLYLTEGSHNLEYAVSAWVGYWLVTITVDGEVVVDSEVSTVNDHVVAEIYVKPETYEVGIGARNQYYYGFYDLPVGIDGMFAGNTCDYYWRTGEEYTIEVPDYVLDYYGYTIVFDRWECTGGPIYTPKIEITFTQQYQEFIAVYTMQQ